MDRTQSDVTMQSQETATNQAANAQSSPIGGSSVGATTPTYKILPPLVDTKRAPVFRFYTETNDRRKCIQDDCTHETGDKHASNLEKHLERHHRDANTELQRIKAEKDKTVTPAKRKNDVTILLDTTAQKVQKTIQSTMVMKFAKDDPKQVRICRFVWKRRNVQIRAQRQMGLAFAKNSIAHLVADEDNNDAAFGSASHPCFDSAALWCCH